MNPFFTIDPWPSVGHIMGFDVDSYLLQAHLFLSGVILTNGVTAAAPKDAIVGGVPNTSAGTGDMGQKGGVPARRGGLRRRPRQCLAVPLHLLSERRR